MKPDVQGSFVTKKPWSYILFRGYLFSFGGYSVLFAGIQTVSFCIPNAFIFSPRVFFYSDGMLLYPDHFAVKVFDERFPEYALKYSFKG